MKDISRSIDRIERLVEEAINGAGVGYLSSIIMEKVMGDEKGNVQRVDLNKSCPAAARERISIASETAKMNEKNLKGKEAALRSQAEKAAASGDTQTASTLQQRLTKVTEYRTTNLKNMDRLESIASDYAVKYKPKDDLYDQRAHALFLKQHKEKMEARMKEESEAQFPNPEAMEKLKRRMARIDSAQKESNAWLEKNDSKWISGTVASKGDEKEVAKREGEKIQGEIKAKQEAEKAAVAPTGQTQPTPTASTTQQTTQQASQQEPTAAPAPTPAERQAKQPGSTWKTSRGAFGAMNKGGIIKYFKSEEDASTYAGLEKGKRRGRKAKVPTDGTPMEVKPRGEKSKATRERATVESQDLAQKIVSGRLQAINEIYRDSGLGKWFRQSADDTPGWDRYNSKGERAGKCGDAEEGEAYAACLSPEKAKKLGKEGISSFVRRKRAAQRKAGMGKKGKGEAGGGAEPVRVSTGIDKVKEEWSQEYKDSIDCNNPKGFSQRAHCQGKEKNMEEQKQYTIADYEQGIKDLKALIEKHKKLADEAKAKGDMKAYRMHSGHVSEYYADIRTTKEMIKRAERAAKMNEASENEPTNPELWSKVQDLVAGRSSSMEHNGETIEGPNGGKGFDVHPSAYSNAWASKLYKRLGGGWRTVSEGINVAAISLLMRGSSRRGRGGYLPSPEEEKKSRAVNQALRDQQANMNAEREAEAEAQRGRDATALAIQRDIEARRSQKKADGPVVGIDDQRPFSIVRTKNGFRAKNKEGNIRYFDDEREARAWLDGGARGVQKYMSDREAATAAFHSRSMREAVSSIIINSLTKKLVTEEEKPYKGFVKGKNHPEGGLSRAEAKRQGIHAGIETKDEAERKGGFSKLSPKTQKRRQSFCSRMCGMKEKNTSAETAADPDSKINAALRVWGCRC